MPQVDQETVTRLLADLRGGKRTALNELFPLVYEELRALAHLQRRHWHGDYTLNTTALVHEAYLRLVNQSKLTWNSRPHFMGVAARAMRQILIDYARQRQTRKRGGELPKVSFDEVEVLPENVLALTEKQTHVLLALDEALQRLEHTDARRARVVEYRFFGRMTIEDTAAALGISRNTVKRDWNLAQVWLYREMRQILPDQGSLDPLS